MSLHSHGEPLQAAAGLLQLWIHDGDECWTIKPFANKARNRDQLLLENHHRSVCLKGLAYCVIHSFIAGIPCPQ